MSAPDGYDREYLGSDEALYRERSRSQPHFLFLAGASAVLGGLGAVSLAAGMGGDPQGFGGAILFGVLTATTLLASVALSVSRVVVTRALVRINHGWRDREIPLEAIESLSIGTFDALSKPKLRADGAEAWGVSAIGGRYVRIAWSDAEGKKRVFWVVSDTPEALVRAIESARHPAGGGVSLRVAAEASPAGTADSVDEIASENEVAGTRDETAP